MRKTKQQIQQEKKESFIPTVENKVVFLASYIGLKNISQDTFFYDFQELRLKQNRNDINKQIWFYNHYKELFTPSVLSKTFIGQTYYYDKTLTLNERIKKTINSFYGSIRRIYDIGILSTNIDIKEFSQYINLAYDNKFRGTIDRKTYHKYLLTLRSKMEKPFSIKISEIYRYVYPNTLDDMLIDDISKISDDTFEIRKNMLFSGIGINTNNVNDLMRKLKKDIVIFVSRIPFEKFLSFSMKFHIRFEVFNMKNNHYDIQEFFTLTRMNHNRIRLISSIRKSFRAILTSFSAISTSVVYHIFMSNIHINLYK